MVPKCNTTMTKTTQKPNEKNVKNRKEDGYISFNPDELKNITQEGDPNDEAYELLWDATCVSVHVKSEDKESGHIESDDIYPTTAEEVNRMEELIDKAESALKEPSTEFNERVKELRDVVKWSRKRHWKLNWRVILGVLLSVFFLQMCVDSKQGDVKSAESKVAQIEKWQEAPLSKLNLDDLKEQKYVICKNPFVSLAVWHDKEQRNVAHDYYTAIANIASCEADLKQTDISKQLKEFYQDQIKSNKEKKSESLKRFKELQEADFKDVQKMALEEAEGKVDEKKSSANFVMFWNIFFLLLIPVYIFAARPHGYTISRYRREANMLNWVEKIGLWLSGGLLSAGLSIGFVDIVTKWSDGSTTRKDDGTGPARLAIKFALLAGAALIFCAVSCLLMLYATITGLIRNYNWTTAKNKTIALATAAKDKYSKK